MKTRIFALLVACTPVAALAQVTAIGPFTGTAQDGYETQTRGQFLPSYPIFGGTATVQHESGGSTLHITTGWSFFSSIFPHSGEVFLGSAGGGYDFVFNTPAFRFGGYWGTNADLAGADVTFFDAQNVQIGGTMSIAAPQGQWQWDGWEFAGAGVTRIHIDPLNQFNGFIMSDDIEYSPVPEPSAFVVLGAGLALLLARRRK
jgi:hypothetical protein